MFRASRKVSSYDFAMSDAEFEARVDELLNLEHSALENTTWAALESHKRSYTTFCRSARLQAFPISFLSLGLFLVQYCRWCGNTARSIPSIVSHLKRINRQYSSQWLNYEDSCRLADLIKSLKKRDANPLRQKLPITHEVMSAIQASADLTSHQDFQHIVMSRVARDALLRGAELISLRMGQITWNETRTEATVSIVYSKAHKRMDKPERVIISDYGPSSGVVFLREYFRVFNLDSKPPGSPLWPFVTDAGKVEWTTPTSKYAFIKRARALLTRAGYPAAKYAGHSYRSGGATDLWESARCRPLTIKLQGRWKSDAYRLYIRDNPHKTAQEVAHAMAYFETAISDDVLVFSPSPCA
jgi:integrase